jgi:hypothetical protein
VLNPFPLRDFTSFTSTLRQTRLPGTRDRRLLRKVHSLAARCEHLEGEGQQSVKDVAHKYRPIIRRWRPVLSALERTRRLLAETENHCEEMYPDPLYWKKLFRHAEESLLDISYTIRQIQQRAVDQLHPRSLKKKETAKWHPLRPQYDYPLNRLGWKPVERWLLDQLDNLIYRYFREREEELTPGDRYKLIQAIWRAAFDEHKEIDSIKVAVLRIAKRRDHTPVK